MVKTESLFRRTIALLIAMLLVFAGLQVLTVASAPAASAAAGQLAKTDLALPAGVTTVNSLASSSDGTKLVFITGSLASSGPDNAIYTSSDSGSTWTLRKSNFANSPLTWVTSSSSGQHLAVVSRTTAKIWRSSNYGQDWSESSLTGCSAFFINEPDYRNPMAMSEDGSVIAMIPDNATCWFLSENYGSTWTIKQVPSGFSFAYVAAIHMSGDGNTIWLAKSQFAGGPGFLYKYTRTNASYSANYSSTVGFPMGVSGSSDGSIVYTAGDGNISEGFGSIFVSTDSGANFSRIGPNDSSATSTKKAWTMIRASGDGTKIIGWDRSDYVWLSQDSGVSWVRQIDPTSLSLTNSKISSVHFVKDGSAAYITAGRYYPDSSPVAKIFRYAFPKTSTTTLTSQNASRLYGAANTLTATVDVNTAAGTVDFKNNGTSITGCSAQTVTAGIATCASWKPAVGTYSNITAIYSGDGSLLGSTSSAISFAVTVAPLTITASSPSVSFGASVPLITASYSGLVNSDTSTVVSGLSCSTVYTTTSPASTTPASTCSGGTASNYSISYGAGSVTIIKATPTFNTWTPVGKTYGASGFDLTAPISSTAGTFTYSSATPAVLSLSGATASVVGVGSSVITATFTPTDSVNFNAGGTATTTATVAKALLGITASSHTVAFGDAKPSITPTFSGFVNEESSSVLSNLVCTTSYTSATPVGTIASNCSGATAANYSLAYTAGLITVQQAGQTSALTISSTIATYGTNLSLTTSGGSGSGANSFVVNSGPCTVSGSTLTSTGAGTCMVTATKAANGNYLIAHSPSTAITVSPKNLIISGLSGVNKEFNKLLSSSATGTPTLVGVVGSDNVLLDGTPIFTFATSDAENGKTVTAAGFTLAGTTAINYTLTQPTLTANITKKAARVTATDLTVAVGGSITAAFTTSGFIAGDAISSASYTYSGTGTSSAPTAVGIYTITPSNAIYGSGSSGNYTITYEAAALTILDKYTVIYNANSGLVASNATASVDFVVGDNALALPTPTRSNFTFTGWHTLQINGSQITGAYTPTASVTLWAHWVQNSLYGMGANTKILTITTLVGVGNTYSASAGGGTIAIQYLADALPAGTVIDAYVLADTSNAATVIGAGNNYVMSLVLAWLAPEGTVPTTAAGKAISMTITNASIKRGAKIFSVIGSNSTLLGVAAVDGSATVSITDDPQIFIAITRPDAPTAISATSGGNESSIITWSAPTSDGGSAITGYTVTASSGQTCTSATTSCSMVGLTNGTAYTFTVTATNALGISDVSSVSLQASPAALIVVTAPAPAPSTGLSLAEQAVAEAKAVAELKAAKELAAAIAAEAARLAALASKITAPALTLYSISASLKLGARDTAYLKKYVATLRSSTIVTCIGYVYPGKTSAAKAKALAVTQATVLCKTIKAFKKTLKTSIVTYASKKAPVAAKGSKWVAVSYRVDASRVL